MHAYMASAGRSSVCSASFPRILGALLRSLKSLKPKPLPCPPHPPVNFSLAVALCQSFSNIFSSTCSVSKKFFESASLTLGLKIEFGSTQGSRNSGFAISTFSTRVTVWVFRIFLASST